MQKEIRQALDVANEKPPGTIFVIPICIEPCELPESLSKFQGINFSNLERRSAFENRY